MKSKTIQIVIFVALLIFTAAMFFTGVSENNFAFIGFTVVGWLIAGVTIQALEPKIS